MNFKKRIFVALPISKRLQEEILRWEKKFSNLRVRWLLGKNLHITLIPPWYGDEENLNFTIEKVGETVKKFNLFKIVFEEVSYGLNPRSPRLIWAAGKAPKEILKLKNNLEEFLNYKSEYRDWILHLTLARFNESDFYKFPIKKLKEKIFWEDEIKSVVLMESRLSRAGADYEVLKEFKL